MPRLHADLLLLAAAIIWGTTFIAQKIALPHIGPYTFVAARFLVSGLLIAPLAFREYKKLSPGAWRALSKTEILLLCIFFSIGVIVQQIGIGLTTVTNAGFLTGLYVVFVPLACRFLYKQKLSPAIVPAALLSLAGVWMLAGGRLDTLSIGDVLIIICAVSFAFQIVLAGRIMEKIPAPFCLSLLQFVAVIAPSLPAAFIFEQPTTGGLTAAALPVLYAGVLSGAFGYTVQIVAQRYTPASDAGVIMSAEAVFAAIAGALILGERLLPLAYGGCALIGLAILLVELGPYIRKKRL